MSFLDELENESKTPVEKTAFKRQYTQVLTEDQLLLDLKLAKDPSDIYRASDFTDAGVYAQALEKLANRTPPGWYAGFIINFTMGTSVYESRLLTPVRDAQEAWASPQVVSAMVAAVKGLKIHLAAKS